MFGQPPCHGTSSVCHSDRHAKDGRGLRGAAGVLRGSWGWWLSSCNAPGELLAGCSAVSWPCGFLPRPQSTGCRGGVRAGSGHPAPPPEKRLPGLGWAGLGSSGPPGNTVGNKESLFAVAELGWPHSLSPRGRDAARLGWRVLPWLLSAMASPSLLCPWQEWDAL